MSCIFLQVAKRFCGHRPIQSLALSPLDSHRWSRLFPPLPPQQFLQTRSVRTRLATSQYLGLMNKSDLILFASQAISISRCWQGSVTITGRSLPDKCRNPSAAKSTEALRWPDLEAFQGKRRLLEDPLTVIRPEPAVGHQEQRPSTEAGRAQGVRMGELTEKEGKAAFPSNRRWRLM